MRIENLDNNVLNEQLLEDIREYVKIKTGKLYLRNIKRTGDNIMITCPFHKDGQERRPSCGIRLTPDEYSSIGTVHCFTCRRNYEFE